MNHDNRDHLRAMLDAFNAVVGPALAIQESAFRTKALRELDRRGFGAEDVTAVMTELKRLTAAMPQRYDATSLEFGVAIARADKFEERALRMRLNRAKKKTVKAKAPVPKPPMLSPDEFDRSIAEIEQAAEEFRAKLLKRRPE